MICKHCNGEISAHVQRCPHCGELAQAEPTPAADASGFFSAPGDLGGSSTGGGSAAKCNDTPVSVTSGLVGNPIKGAYDASPSGAPIDGEVVPREAPSHDDGGSSSGETRYVTPERAASHITCPCCGNAVKPGARFCTHCGAPLDSPAESPVGGKSTERISDVKKAGTSSSRMGGMKTLLPAAYVKPVNLILLAICAVLWLFTPFFQIGNASRFGNPEFLSLNAIQVISFVEEVGILIALPPISAVIAIALCIIFTLLSNTKAVKITAIIMESIWALWLGLAVLEATSSSGFISPSTVLKLFFSMLGIGFWGIFLLMFALIAVNWKSKKAV